jgi:hypothetical protein
LNSLIALYNRLNAVNGVFDEAAHKYNDDLKTEYTSATTFIKEFEKEVDWDYWKKKKADERNITVADIEREWKAKTDKALIRGNEIHNALEDAVNDVNKEVGYDTAKVLPIGNISYSKLYDTIASLRTKDIFLKYAKIRVYLEKLIENGYVLFAEYRLYRPEFGIAGTVDLMAVKSNDIIIIDWKTNKHPMLFVSGYFKKRKIGNITVTTNQFIPTLDSMKPPISHLPSCIGVKYSLQLSIYAYMLSFYGFNIKGLVLFHIKRNEALQQEEVFSYNLKNYNPEIFQMLKYTKRL